MSAIPRNPTPIPVVARRRQARLIKKRAAAMPLFVAAGIADDVQPIPTVSEIERQYRDNHVALIHKMSRSRCVQRAAAAIDRGTVAALLGRAVEERLAAYRWRTYPPTPPYCADFWHRKSLQARVVNALRRRGAQIQQSER